MKQKLFDHRKGNPSFFVSRLWSNNSKVIGCNVDSDDDDSDDDDNVDDGDDGETKIVKSCLLVRAAMDRWRSDFWPMRYLDEVRQGSVVRVPL